MSQITFSSTYRIPVNQIGIKKTQITQFKNIVDSYSGVIIGTGRDQYALLSIPDRKDLSFFQKIHKLGYFQIKKYDGENIPRHKLKEYVQSMISKMNK